MYYRIKFRDGHIECHYADQLLTPDTGGFLYTEGRPFFILHAYDNPEEKTGWHFVGAFHQDVVMSIRSLNDE